MRFQTSCALDAWAIGGVGRSTLVLADLDSHGHNLGDLRWPFAGPENVEAICCIHVLDGDRPILRVSHDDDDGMWQLLCGGLHEDSDARIVCLGCMVKRDTSLVELSNLPLGWGADRDGPDGQWVPSENPPLDDDDQGGKSAN